MIRSALSAVLALAVGLSLAIRWALPAEEAGDVAYVVGLGAAVTGAILAWLAFRWFVWRAEDGEPLEAPRAALLTLAAACLLAVAFMPARNPLAWEGHAATGPVGLATFDRQHREQWGERRSGFELHAAAPGGFPGTWRATADLPPAFQYIGGRLRLFVTQPEWAVLDRDGRVHPGSDGVRVEFVIEADGRRVTLESLELHPHENPGQRRWHPIDLKLPRGSRRVVVDVSPGPPGSNDWHDRVWISPGDRRQPLDHGLAFADGLAIGLAVWLVTIGLGAAVRPPYAGWRGVRALVAVNTAAMALIFAAAEVYVRASGTQPYARTYPGQFRNAALTGTWIQPDPRFGWVARPGSRDPTIAPIDADGFRNPPESGLDAATDGPCRIMVLGDSFAFGASVRVEDNLATRLMKSLGPGHSVINLAMQGWGLDQMFLAYRAFEPSVRPDIILLVFIDDDVDRVLEAYRAHEGVNKPSFTIRGGQLAPRPAASPADRALGFFSGRSAVLGSIAHRYFMVRDARPIVRHVITTIASESNAAGRRFVVVRIPTLPDLVSRSGAAWPRLVDVESVAVRSGAEYLDLDSALRAFPGGPGAAYIEGDGHLTPAGNNVAADRIARFLQNEPGAPANAAPSACDIPAVPIRAHGTA